MNLGHLYIVTTTLVDPPKDKLVICVCAERNWFVWINTLPRYHGVAQLPLRENDHPALARDCHLDCSRITTFRDVELQQARDRGPISTVLANSIVEFLGNSAPKTLPESQRLAIIANLTGLKHT